MKKKTGIARLLEIAGERRGLLILSGLLSVLSALIQMVPFAAIYFIAKELLQNAASPEFIDKNLIRNWGVYALISLAVALVLLYAGTMASHVSAFRIFLNPKSIPLMNS
ncbi:MAG TPA: ABC transporter ATP-binding protein, partial [Lachnospiraceae bacterium]|nr:ABC transporter ATP-binding protein [Lachnospiraceae bacterium]